MKASAKEFLRVLIYEGTGSHPIPAHDRLQIFRTLLEKGYAVSSTRAKGRIAPLQTGEMLVLGLFEGGIPPQAEDAEGRVNLRFRDIHNLDSEKIFAEVENLNNQHDTKKPGEWKPWFPVIDYDRCTNCMQCLSFCLFGVYGVSENQKIQVQNEDQCKTDCPACSRVCPEVAILFPKYKAGPINGDVVRPEDLQREKMKIDISALLGGDIYQVLRERTQKAQSRFAKERDEERALKERQKCLEKLQGQMDIPPEVLKSLPSVEEIRAKAEEAKARAQALLQN